MKFSSQFIAFCVAVAFCCNVCGADNETVTVDFSKNDGPVTGRACGLLHSVAADAPGDEMIAPLKPRMWRFRAFRCKETEKMPVLYPRLKKLGVKHFQVILSDEFGYSKTAQWPGDGDSWSAWDRQVQAVLDTVKENGFSVQYDIWNEPDSSTFWPRDRQQFFDLWKHTVELIRAAQPKAVIVGPSAAWFKMEWMKDFLLFAKANNVLPDVISWHENHSDGVPYSYLKPRIAEVRKFLAENEIPITRFSINEYLGEYNVDLPGSIVGYFAALEDAKVESAAHSGWQEAGTYYVCDLVSLDGLLDSKTLERRATWWVYKAYADFSGQLFELKPSATVQGLASWDGSNKTGRILLGRWKGGDEPVRLVLTGLDKIGFRKKDAALQVRVDRIIPSGWSASSGPKQEMDCVIKRTSRDVELTLPALGRNDACSIVITEVPAQK